MAGLRRDILNCCGFDRSDAGFGPGTDAADMGAICSDDGALRPERNGDKSDFRGDDKHRHAGNVVHWRFASGRDERDVYTREPIDNRDGGGIGHADRDLQQQRSADRS